MATDMGGKTLHKCKNLMWHMCQNIFLVKSNLLKKRVLVNQSSPMCGNEFEDVFHAHVACPNAKRIWFSSSLGLRIKDDRDGDFRFYNRVR